MSNHSSDGHIPQRIWGTTLVLVLALAAGSLAAALVAQAASAPMDATAPVVDADLDASDALAADALGLRVAQRIQQQLELAAVLAVWLPLAGLVGVGLFVALLAGIHRLLDSPSRPVSVPTTVKPVRRPAVALPPPQRKAMTWLLNRSKPVSVTR